MRFPKRTFDKPIPISPLIGARPRALHPLLPLHALLRDRRRGRPARRRQPRRAARSSPRSRTSRTAPTSRATSSSSARSGRSPRRRTASAARPWEIQNVPDGLRPLPGRLQHLGDDARGQGRARPLAQPPRGRRGLALRQGPLRLRATCAPTTASARPLTRVRRRGFEPVSLEEAVDAAERGLREADGSVVVAFSGAETVEQATAIARLVQEGLGSRTAHPSRDVPPGARRASGRRSRRSGDAERLPRRRRRPRRRARADRRPLAPRRPPRRRRGRHDPPGRIRAGPARAAPPPSARRSRVRPTLRRSSAPRRAASSTPSAWRSSGRRTIRPAARTSPRSRKALGRESLACTSCRARRTAEASPRPGASRRGDRPTGEIGALIVSGDEAASDPRVRELAERARFVLTTAMFMTELTVWSHLVVPGTSYLERDGTTVNLEGRPQRQRRAVAPPAEDDELVFFARLAGRFGVEVDPWPGRLPDEHAPLAARRSRAAPRCTTPGRSAPPKRAGRGLELVRYRAALQRPGRRARAAARSSSAPLAEVELSAADATRARASPTGTRYGSARTGPRRRSPRASTAASWRASFASRTSTREGLAPRVEVTSA